MIKLNTSAVRSISRIEVRYWGDGGQIDAFFNEQYAIML